MKKYNINNLSEHALDYKYIIIRDCGKDGYWYYGADDDVTVCSQIAREIGNGIVIEACQVEL